MRILIIEDERLLADSLRTLLQGKGFGPYGHKNHQSICSPKYGCHDPSCHWSAK